MLFALCSVIFLGCPGRPAAPAEGQFAQTGQRKVATIARDCGQLTDFVFSPDGQNVIYAGFTTDDRDPRAGVWVGDSLIARADSIFEIGFSETNKPYFVGMESGRAFLYYGYARPRAYDQVIAPAFSRDGERVAYLTVSGSRRLLVISDGSAQTVGGVLDFAFSPTGDRFAYATLDSGDWIVVDNGDTSDINDWVQNLTFSRDGRSLAYAAMADDEWFVVVNSRELDHMDSTVTEISDVALSDDGNHVAYVVTAEGGGTVGEYEFAVIDDYESDAYGDVSNPVFAPRGRAFAFIADDGEGQFAVTAKGDETPYDEVWNLAFSPDALHHGYSARDGDDEFCVLDGAEYPAHDAVDKVIFSRDSRRFGYGALDGNDFNWVVENVK